MKRSMVVLALFIAAGCGETTAPDLRLDPNVRVVHAAPETPRVEVVLDGVTRARLDYAEVSDLFTLPTGDRRIQLLAEGETEAVIDLTSTLESAVQYTVIAAGVAGSVAPIVLIDDATPADSAETRIRVVHAAPTAGEVDVYVTNPGTELATQTAAVTAMAFGDASDYMVVESRTYQVRVAISGSTELLIDLPLLVLSSTRVLTIVIMDTMGSGPPHGLIVLPDDRP